MTRPITSRYDDPVELIWCELVRSLGMTLTRTDQAYATYDGRGEMAVAVANDMDADDCVAQMVLHELCHALIEGRRGLKTLDWNLPWQEHDGAPSQEAMDSEHAAQRLQAHFADQVGMREFFASTTQWRSYWDALDSWPLRGDSVAARKAIRGLEHAKGWSWYQPIGEALKRTARIAEALGEAAPPGSLWRTAKGRNPHSGFPYTSREDEGWRCGGCAWALTEGVESGWAICLQAGARRVTVPLSARGCRRHEVALLDDDCGRCGACCREGFDEVEVGAGEPLTGRSDVVVARQGYAVVPRPDGRCVLLDGDGGGAPYRCQLYAERPQSCRDFEVGSANCLLARQRVGLSVSER